MVGIQLFFQLKLNHLIEFVTSITQTLIMSEIFSLMQQIHFTYLEAGKLLLLIADLAYRRFHIHICRLYRLLYRLRRQKLHPGVYQLMFCTWGRVSYFEILFWKLALDTQKSTFSLMREEVLPRFVFEITHFEGFFDHGFRLATRYRGPGEWV